MGGEGGSAVDNRRKANIVPRKKPKDISPDEAEPAEEVEVELPPFKRFRRRLMLRERLLQALILSRLGCHPGHASGSGFCFCGPSRGRLQ